MKAIEQKIMSQRKLILVVTAVLLVAIGAFGAYRQKQATPLPTAANAVVTTGISVVLSEPLAASAKLTVEDSAGKKVLTRSLEAKAQRFNLTLAPGVYRFTVTPKDTPPFTSNAVTVSDGKLSLLELDLPHVEDELDNSQN
jgi:hypothetical protein